MVKQKKKQLYITLNLLEPLLIKLQIYKNNRFQKKHLHVKSRKRHLKLHEEQTPSSEVT